LPNLNFSHSLCPLVEHKPPVVEGPVGIPVVEGAVGIPVVEGPVGIPVVEGAVELAYTS
jgi:hypothetical protein